METRQKNLWLSDIRAAITPALEACSSSDLPTTLVIGEKRIPFEVERVRLVVNDEGNVEGLEIYLPQEADCEKADKTAKPRACDVMSEEALVQVATNGITALIEARKDELVGFGLRELVEVIVASAIKCAYDTQLVKRDE